MSNLKAPYLESQQRLHALLDGLSDDAFNAKPSEKSWSAGECVVHLNKIAKGYLPKMEAAVADPAAPRGEGPFRYGWLSRRFIASVTPGSRSLPTAGAMKPPAADGLRSAVDRQRAVEHFDADVARYVAVIEAAGGLDLARIKIASPFLSILRLPLGAFLDAMGQHSLRHVLQAERAVAATGGAR